MNIKDLEGQEDMEISEKEDDTASNIYRALWKTYTKKETGFIYSTDMRQLCMLYVPNVHQKTQIQTTTLTVSNVQPNIQR